MRQKLAFGILILGLFAGALFAIGGVTPTLQGTQSRWAGGTAAAISTQGGNISVVNVAATTLTDKWTAFSGNVTGTIVLGNNTAFIYNWTFSAGTTGKICISTNTSMGFTAPTAATAAGVNTAFSMGASADNATNTFNGNCAAMTLSTGPVTPIRILTQGSSTYNTCAITADGASTLKGNYAFCAVMSSTGKNYLNNPVTYEIMAPTATGGTAESYYFYAELS